MKRHRRLRRLEPDAELLRRRAAGETLRDLARDYRVSHTTLGRYFARADVARQLKQAERLLRAEERAEEARRRAELKAERQAYRPGTQRKIADERGTAGRAPVAARPPKSADLSETRSDGSASFSAGGPPDSRMGIDFATRRRASDPYLAWLESPKNLSGRALAEASGLVRLRNPEGTVTRWVEAADAPALLEEGWSRA